MDPFVAQHVTRAKWVFVPSHAVGRTIGERIALEGTNWLNLRFVTPLDVALRMGAPFLVERGIDPSEEGLGPALVMRLLLEVPTGSVAENEARVPGPVREQPHPSSAPRATCDASGACAVGSTVVNRQPGGPPNIRLND